MVMKRRKERILLPDEERRYAGTEEIAYRSALRRGPNSLPVHHQLLRPLLSNGQRPTSCPSPTPSSCYAALANPKPQCFDVQLTLQMMQDFIADRAVIAQADKG
jgi:hypothetical protein